jgi:hypothetical protein
MGYDDDRRGNLLLVVNDLLATWQKWTANQDLKYITLTFETAVEDTILVFSEGTIPGDLRRLTALIGDLKKHWETWKVRAAGNPNRFQHPGTDFWAVLEAITQHLADLKRPPPKRLEAVSKLRALPGMTDNQICRTYGWYDSNGNPELWKIDEEEADPGKHSYKCEGWLPPHERERQRIEAAQAAAVDRAKEQRLAKIKALTRPPAPEPIEDLLKLPGISGKQICTMKHLDRDEFEHYCRENQLRLPSWDSPAANQISGVFDVNQDTPEVRREETKADALKNPKKPEAEKPPAEEDDTRPASVIQGMNRDEADDDENEPASVLQGPDKPSEDPSPGPEQVVMEGQISVEAQIVMLHKAGVRALDIANDLGRTDASIDLRRVNKVLRQFEKSPASIPLPSDAVV